MTVAVETPLASSTANGVTTVFPHAFTLLLAGDLVVTGTLSGVTTTYVNGVDYTITGLGTSSGSVVFTVAPANGTVVTRYRDTAILRATDYQTNGDLLAPVLNADFDRQVYILQEVVAGGKGSPTALRVPNGETVPALPDAADRASRVLAFDSSGNPIAIAGVDAGSAAALALDLADSTSAAKGAALSAYNRARAYSAASVGGQLRGLQILANDLTSLLAAIAEAKTAGRPTVIWLNGTVSTTATILVDAPNITIKGAGGDTSHDVGSSGGGARARINWGGIAGGTVVRFASPTGASNQACSGGGMQGVFVDCAGVAAIGLQVQSWRKGVFSDLHFDNPTTVGLDIGVVATLGEARDPQNNEFRRISSRHYEVAGGTGGLLRLGGDATANTSLNYFEQLDCSFLNGDAYIFNNTDNNVVMKARAFRGVGGTGNALVFNGSNANSEQVARGNIFLQLSTNGPLPIVHRGTETFTHPSINNNVWWIDFDNGYSTPTFGTGATGSWSDTRGLQGGMFFVGTSAGDNITNALAARSRLGASGALHLVNGSSDHLQLSDAANTNRWGANLDGSGNFRTVRLAGTGVYLDALNAYGNFANDAAAATGGVPVGGRYRNGSIMMIRVA